MFVPDLREGSPRLRTKMIATTDTVDENTTTRMKRTNSLVPQAASNDLPTATMKTKSAALYIYNDLVRVLGKSVKVVSLVTKAMDRS